jgi:type II secretory pathway component PulF
MPQLSVETFVTQYFWLLIVFFALFLFFCLFFIPKISNVKKIRKLLESSEVSFSTVYSHSSVSLFNKHKC